MTQQLLRLPQLQARVPLSRAVIYARIADGQFPAPIQIGPKAVAWLADEVDQWIADRVAASRTIDADAPESHTT